MRHESVLLNEIIELLKPKKGDRVIDCTLGDGGHAEAILNLIGEKGKLLGIDADPESLLRAKRYLYKFGEGAVFARDNFKDLKKIAQANGFEEVDAILMDLGWSSPQFEERGRGFSFEKDEPLDMRFDPNDAKRETAAAILNNSSKPELVKIFKQFGEEKFSDDIASAVVEKRAIEPVLTTKQLVGIILSVYREKLHTDKEVPWTGGSHPATKIFQGLRIAVNQELESLKQALPQAVDLLAIGGRLAVITFHSLEDRIVKQFFAGIAGKQIGLINKKPIGPDQQEIAINRRARSAKVRAVIKL
ncbi:MAG: 16S rRNA (cytosine(1402)-N(4))-methyltransferase RsmH [Candidatus Magasanikbacteria bacterium]|nr:16S rRNA (cytosine(1402)-N(4))-methyltransferase RsmH [Candidatus Magasanikbacteria bacterium]